MSFKPSDLLRAQDKYFSDVAKLRTALAGLHPDWLVKVSELGTLRVRKVRIGRVKYDDVTDRVHIENSHHYEWLASDWSLFVPVSDNQYRQVTSSEDPEWKEVHALWLGLDPLNVVMPAESADAGHLARKSNESDPRI